jgi:hypothetical protein
MLSECNTPLDFRVEIVDFTADPAFPVASQGLPPDEFARRPHLDRG